MRVGTEYICVSGEMTELSFSQGFVLYQSFIGNNFERILLYNSKINRKLQRELQSKDLCKFSKLIMIAIFFLSVLRS